MTSLAGCGLTGFADGPGFAARFNHPDGLAIGVNGAIYVADNGNNAIRCLQTNGQLFTVAGTGQSGFRDGDGSIAQFATPTGMGIDLAGNLVVPDYGNNRVRSIALSPALLAPIATRELPASYQPGQKITVQIAVNPPANTTAYAVEDQLPDGWQIGATLNNNGQYDAKNRVVKFGPFIDHTARTLSYEVQSPASGGGAAEFIGWISVDGSQNSIGGDSEISPGVYHPADLQPADFRVSIGELTAYGAAWIRGDLWILAPNPIPIGYVTRAAYLWRNGEAYRYDPLAGTLPMAWVSDTNSATPTKVQPGGAGDLSVARIEQSGSLRSLGETANEATAIMPATFVPGQPITVEIAVQPLTDTQIYAIEEILPDGWDSANISDEGSFDTNNRKIKWGPFFDATPRTLRYQTIPPQGATQTAVFSGVASFDGVDVTVAGNRQATLTATANSGLAIKLASDGSRSFEVTLSGALGSVVRIDYSEDLKIWQTIQTVTNQSGNTIVVNPATPNLPMVFYRIVPVQ